MNREQILALAEEQGAVANLKQHFNMAGDSIVFTPEELEAFYHAAIESYKAELLKEAGEPALYTEFAEDGGWLGDTSECADHLEEPHALFTSDQVAAAIAKAEQRVAEACAELAYSRDYEVEGRGYYDQGGDARQTCYDIYDAIKKGEWRKFVKEV